VRFQLGQYLELLGLLKEDEKTMFKLFVYVVAVTFLSAAALAAPKAEIFGGYQLTHFDGGPNSSGWNAALTGNFNSWLGITADFSSVLLVARFTPTHSDQSFPRLCRW